MDPGAVPEALQDLITVEQMLIARMAAVMSVIRLSQYRGGQWRFKGHVVCFPQDIQPVVSVLPVSLLMFLYYVANSLPTLTPCVNFASTVKGCITHFMEHNRYYRDISVSVENLEQLPDDGPLQLRLYQNVTEPRRAHW